MQTPWMQTSLDVDSIGCRPPRMQTPSDADPRDVDPLGCRPPWMQTPLDTDPPPGCRLSWIQTPSPAWTEWQTLVKKLPCPKRRLWAVKKLIYLFLMESIFIWWKHGVTQFYQRVSLSNGIYTIQIFSDQDPLPNNKNASFVMVWGNFILLKASSHGEMCDCVFYRIEWLCGC